MWVTQMTLRPQTLGMMLLIAGAAVDSTSGLFTRLLQVDGFTTASGRGFFAFALLFCILLLRDRQRALASILGLGLWGALFVGLNASAMVMNVLSLKFTAVANFFMIFATAPFVAAVMARTFLGERLEFATLLASVAGFAGIAVMMLGSAQGGGMIGNLLAVAVVLSYGALVLMMRRTPDIDVLPLITMTVLASGLIAWPFSDFSKMQGSADWSVMAALGFIQLGLGNMLIYNAISRIPAAQAGLLGILIAAFAPLWVFIALREVPPVATLIGGAIILAAAALHLGWTLRRTPTPA